MGQRHALLAEEVTMTAVELINKLRTCPPDREVKIEGCCKNCVQQIDKVIVHDEYIEITGV
jgi:hypothetical protein